MSIIIYATSGQTIWEPSLDVAKLFVEHARLLEPLCGVLSGVGPVVSDEVVIDPHQFGRFLQAGGRLLEQSNSGPLHALVSGFLTLGGGLYRRMTGREPDLPAGLGLGRYDALQPSWSLTESAPEYSQTAAEPMLVRSPSRPRYDADEA